MGYVTLALEHGDKPANIQEVIEFLSTKIGWVLLVLGGMHFFNLYVISKWGRLVAKRSARRESAPNADSATSV